MQRLGGERNKTHLKILKELAETGAEFAEGLYERCGWKYGGRIIDHWGNSEDCAFVQMIE